MLGARITRAYLTSVGFNDFGARLRRSWLDHHSKLLAEYPCRLLNSLEVSPLARQLATRASHSDAFVMTSMVRPSPACRYTLP